MSLRNLLPIGRAFIPAGGNSGRYRPAEAGVMPDFSGPHGMKHGVKVRPAVSAGVETLAEPAVSPAPAFPVAAPGSKTAVEMDRLAQAEFSSGTPPGTPEIPLESSPASGSASGSASSPFAKRSVEASILVERSLSRPPPAPVAKVTGAGDRVGGSAWRLPVWVEQLLSALVRPGNRRRGTRPVQTEMTFERVTVARNDLMTADVEVVSVGGASGRPARLSAACRARLLRLWWGQGSERWKRLGNVFRKS